VFDRLFLFSFESFEKNFSLIFEAPTGRLNVFHLFDQVASFVNLKRKGLLANLENLSFEGYFFGWKMDFVLPPQQILLNQVSV